MSIEITLYPKIATKLKMTSFLKKEGFIKCKHIIDEFNTKNDLHYHWYDGEHFKSIDGVEASVILKKEITETNSKGEEWLLHTRTRSIASREDKEKQNEVIKNAKKLFGGHFDNDRYGKNKYTNLDDYEIKSPLEKGLFLMHENIYEKIEKINLFVNQPDDFSNNYDNIPDSSLKELIQSQNPNRIVYNSLLPFLVSLVEYLLGNSFTLLLKYDEIAYSKLNDDNFKIPIDQVIKISNGELDITEIISETINFQNLYIANKAYIKYFNIDLLKVISINKVVHRKKIFLKNEIENIISLRHKMIHEFAFDYSYDKTNFLFHLGIIEKFVGVFIEHLENDKKLKINIYHRK